MVLYVVVLKTPSIARSVVSPLFIAIHAQPA